MHHFWLLENNVTKFFERKNIKENNIFYLTPIINRYDRGTFNLFFTIYFTISILGYFLEKNQSLKNNPYNYVLRKNITI